MPMATRSAATPRISRTGCYTCSRARAFRSCRPSCSPACAPRSRNTPACWRPPAHGSIAACSRWASTASPSRAGVRVSVRAPLPTPRPALPPEPRRHPNENAGHGPALPYSETEQARLELVAHAQRAPVATVHMNRNGQVLHQGKATATHVATIGLQQEAARIAAGRQAGAIVEDPAISTVRRIPGRVAGALRVGELLVVGWQVTVAIDGGAEHHLRRKPEEALIEARHERFGEREEQGRALD